jgi:hypothetical protein
MIFIDNNLLSSIMSHRLLYTQKVLANEANNNNHLVKLTIIHVIISLLRNKRKRTAGQMDKHFADVSIDWSVCGT